jgi:hypothetical protein
MAAAIAPCAVCAAIAPLRGRIENTNAARVLVLLVVAAAATGGYGY